MSTLVLFSLVSITSTVDRASEQSLPPNVLVLIADDLGVDAVGAYDEGASTPKTPTIDALAQGGLLFRNAWANPVCSTTRATLLTGNYAFRNGIGWLVFEASGAPPLQTDKTILPEALALSTGGLYSSAAFGKWHLGDSSVGGALAPNIAGFPHFAGSLANLIAPENYYNWTKTVNGVSSTVTNYATTETVDDVVAWIDGAREPWYCHVGFHAPHTPYQAPPSHLHSVDLAQPTNRKLFEAMVEALDTEIGRLLASIPAPVLANTMLFFVGDNGSHANITLSPFDSQHAKGTLYEGGLNVPLIVNGPLVQSPGAEVSARVQATDLFRTVLDVAGGRAGALPTTSGVDSISMLSYFADPAAKSARAFSYAEGFRPNGPKQRSAFLPIGGSVTAFVCQEDIGFGGPGAMALSICGEPLHGGYLDSDQGAQLMLSGASPNSLGLLFIGYQANPKSMFGGTIVPNPPTSVISFTTDANGCYQDSVAPDADLLGFRYFQATVDDPALLGQSAVSNCIEAVTLPADQEAVSDGRFKLIVDNRSGQQELFDLGLDPFEQAELLSQGPLSSEIAARYAALRAYLMSLRWSTD